MEHYAQDIFDKLNLNISEEEAASLMETIEQELHERVSEAITLRLDADQIEQLSNFNGSDDELMSWLENNVKGYDRIVNQEVDILLGELVEKLPTNSES